MVQSVTTEEPTFWTCAHSLQLTESTTKIWRAQTWATKSRNTATWQCKVHNKFPPITKSHSMKFQWLAYIWKYSNHNTTEQIKATYIYTLHFSCTFTYTFQLFISSHHQTHLKTHVFVRNVALQQHLNIHHRTSGIWWLLTLWDNLLVPSSSIMLNPWGRDG
jgi:hypothetical protein